MNCSFNFTLASHIDIRYSLNERRRPLLSIIWGITGALRLKRGLPMMRSDFSSKSLSMTI